MEKRLYRNDSDKMLAGVCSGLADYFDVEVTWVRIAFIVATLAGLSGLLVYIIMWVAIPNKPFNPDFSQFSTDYRVDQDKAYTATPGDALQPATPFPPYPKKTKSGNGSVIAGLILIAFGGFFLLNEFDIIPYWVDFGKLWPLAIIIPGILMVARSGKKDKPWKDRPDFNKPTEDAKTTNNEPSI